MTPDGQRWNHNLHHGRRLLQDLPATCARVLDAGCGEGTLTRELARRADLVVGLDLDAATVTSARRRGGASYVRADLLSPPFGPGTFDAVVCVTALHHVDEEQGLRRLAELVRPGGRLLVVGVARSRLPWDLPWEVASAVATRSLQARRGCWQHTAPVVWPPPHTYPQVRALVERVLPGARFRRHLLWRWTLVWARPVA